MEGERVRIDKWLWAARFFKTRNQAAQAVNGGKVHLNNARVKPARLVGTGDTLRIQKGPYEFVVVVQKVSDRRGPALEARQLYEETPESCSARERLRAERRLVARGTPAPPRRPGKRDRRLIKKFIRRD